jgi:RNA-binding protein
MPWVVSPLKPYLRLSAFICGRALFAYTSRMNPLSSKRRSELRAEAHKLAPIVIIGDKGLTDEVLAEVDRALKAHELIKVRAATDDREARGAWMESICEKLGAHPVQQIGKVLVVFRENPKEAKPKVAKPKVDSRPLPPRGGAGNDDRKRGAGDDGRKRAPVDEGRKEASATRKRRTHEEVKRTSRPRSRILAPLPGGRSKAPGGKARNTSRRRSRTP